MWRIPLLIARTTLPRASSRIAAMRLNKDAIGMADGAVAAAFALPFPCFFVAFFFILLPYKVFSSVDGLINLKICSTLIFTLSLP